MLIARTDAERRVATIAAEIAELAMRRLPPFDALQCAGPLDEEEPVISAWGDEQRARLLDSAVALAKFHVAGEMFRDDKAFALLDSVLKEMRPILARRAVPNTSEQWLMRHNYEVADRKRLVQSEMSRYFPDFTLTKGFFKPAIPGTLIFTRPFLEDCRLFIAPSLGRDRNSGMFECYFGLERPFFSVRPGSFFGLSTLDVYYTPTELQQKIEHNLRLLKPLLPVFAQRMAVALEGLDLSAEAGPNDQQQ